MYLLFASNPKEKLKTRLFQVHPRRN